jgi:ABC-type Fe3+/spermidine/putrescine transport system ATPase subunit
MKDVVLEVKDLVVEYGNVRAVDGVSFKITKGEQLTLLGPSGSGKTSILRGVAGLETPHGGEIRLFGEDIFNQEKGINVPVEKRGMSMVFQSYAIWPHMNVFQNVAYPLKVKKLSKKAINEKVNNTLKLVRMKGLEDRSATKLSGGQQQRVALARAIVDDPKMILLDEPLSNLDAILRARMRVELKELQNTINVTSMFVTHDQEEAFVISDRIIVLSDGKIEQVGSPEEIYRKPRTRFVAEFIPSANLFKVNALTKGKSNHFVCTIDGGHSMFCNSSLDVGKADDKFVLYVNASFFKICDLTEKDKLNTWKGKVKSRFFVGDFLEYFVDSEIGTIKVRGLPTHFYREGGEICVRVDPENCHLIRT